MSRAHATLFDRLADRRADQALADKPRNRSEAGRRQRARSFGPIRDLLRATGEPVPYLLLTALLAALLMAALAAANWHLAPLSYDAAAQASTADALAAGDNYAVFD